MTDIALDEKACAQTSLTDHIARFWHMIEDEPHVRILVNVRRDMSSVPYWDSSSFPNDVAKAIAAERRASPSQVAPQPQAGEAVARAPFNFDRYVNGVLMAEDVTIERQTTLDDAMRLAASIASRGPNGEAPVLVYRPAASPQPANPAQVTDAIDEGLEILGNLIDSINRHGNYSAESTCMFIDQASQAFRKARTALVQTEASDA